MTRTERARERMQAIREKADTECYEILKAECEYVLKRCPTLREFVCGNGTRFFIDRNDQIIHEDEDLPKVDQDFIKVCDEFECEALFPYRFPEPA